MKSNPFWALRIGFWLIVVLVIFLLIIFPIVTGFLITVGRMPLGATKYLVAVEYAQTYLMRGLVLLWIFFFGSCFASFLNVVAWRVPRGRGINGSSHCPNCDTKLSFLDNIPIAGWLRNGGQCSSCSIPISPRYLWVEFALGTVFLIVCSVELLGGGINLPLRLVEARTGIENMIFEPKWDLIQLTIYHLVLICLLFTLALVRSERLKIPFAIVAVGLVFGIAMPLIWPSMLLISWQTDSDTLINLTRFSSNQALTLALGIAGGVGFGMILQWGLGFNHGNRSLSDFVIPESGQSKSGQSKLNSEFEPSSSDESSSEAIEFAAPTVLNVSGVATEEVTTENHPVENDDATESVIHQQPKLDPSDPTFEQRSELDSISTTIDETFDDKTAEIKLDDEAANREKIIAKAAIVNAPVIQDRYVYELVAGLGFVGLFIGWQSALSVSIITCLILLLTQSTKRTRDSLFNTGTYMFVATLIHLLGWRTITWAENWPSISASGLTMLAFLTALVSLAIFIRLANNTRVAKSEL
ncbi:MAG: prepilin peptidase [Mariniblastus sp.]